VFCEWGEDVGDVSEDYREQFQKCVNEDLNTARALAVVWELVKSDLPDSVKKATLLDFDRVLGLRLDEWRPTVLTIPDEIAALVEQRQQARLEKRWKDADALRDHVTAAGYEIEDTPDGPQVRMKIRKD
jgi:cysteinyl-tRNA synthetase